MGLTSVIEAYTTGTYKVFRTTEGNYDADGHYQRVPALDADIVSVDFGADTIRVNAHGLTTGDGPFFPSTAGTLPAPLSALTPYWVIVTDANNFKLALSQSDALSAIAVNLDDAGVGVHHVANYLLLPLSIQPAGGGIKDVAEGQHTEKTFTVWSTYELKSREDGWEADVIEYNGELHRIDSVDYFGILSNHWKATITKLETP
jgi:hypothetical protein